jgi:hypothetical protein
VGGVLEIQRDFVPKKKVEWEDGEQYLDSNKDFGNTLFLVS